MWLILVFCLSIGMAVYFHRPRPWLLWGAVTLQLVNGLLYAAHRIDWHQCRRGTGLTLVLLLFGLLWTMGQAVRGLEADRQERLEHIHDQTARMTAILREGRRGQHVDPLARREFAEAFHLENETPRTHLHRRRLVSAGALCVLLIAVYYGMELVRRT